MPPSGASSCPCCARWSDPDGCRADPRALAFGLTFADLAERAGLERLDALFLDQLAEQDAGLHARLMAARAAPPAMAEESRLDHGTRAASGRVRGDAVRDRGRGRRAGGAHAGAGSGACVQAAVRAASGGEEIRRSGRAGWRGAGARVGGTSGRARSATAASPPAWRHSRRRRMPRRWIWRCATPPGRR